MNSSSKRLLETLAAARAEVGKVILGQQPVVDLCLVTVACGQHALLEGVPGVAKTLLVRTLAAVMGSDFKRIQFTPDLMPADITGTNVYNIQKSEFSLVKGPVFTDFLLADEINRAPAKTQSALLQAMQERMVTIDGVTHTLPADFTVFATQNPVEYEGTYPLPEAQKDRFMLKINIDYPGREDELGLAASMLSGETPEVILGRGEVKAVLKSKEVVGMRDDLKAMTLKDELTAYAVDLVRATREEESVLVGAGPRATQSLLLAARAFAAIQDRDFVSPDDIKAMARPVLEHRLVLRPEFEIEQLTVPEVIERILEKVAVPR